ncbi:alpha/beta hydrolase [Colwellia sp. MEBiC06753]
MRGTVSKQLDEFLAQVNLAQAQAKADGIQYTPELVRANLNKLAALLPDVAAPAFIEDRAFQLTDRTIPVRVYSPAPEQALPVVMHFHGGGHMCGSVDLYDPISRMVANLGQCVVICVDYLLAPEHPYPNGIDDCQHALIHYQSVLKGVNYNQQIYILGDSAGGAICTTLAMRSLENPAIKIDKQMLVYPSVDYTMQMPSIEENGEGFLLEKARVKWYFEQYFQSLFIDNVLVTAASPLHGSFSDKLPPTLVLTAGCDPLRDEGIAYAQKLADHGVDVEHHQFEGMIHAYMLLHNLVPEACQQSYHYIADFIKR